MHHFNNNHKMSKIKVSLFKYAFQASESIIAGEKNFSLTMRHSMQKCISTKHNFFQVRKKTNQIPLQQSLIYFF